MKKIYKFSFELCRRIHFKSAKEWKQFMNPKIDGTRIKKIRNISENDMIHKHQILKYPYFKMKKIGKYNKIIKTSDLLFNRSIEIIYDYRYCEIFQKLKDLISFNLKGTYETLNKKKIYIYIYIYIFIYISFLSQQRKGRHKGKMYRRPYL
ncbi:hypothetical protein PFDG_01252 [Plasmodium falciparum Dd2]|uniref:Uncharacterized protein n=1 Tax=Plasmodium falciparum (isolate Dd2) TaxID=57267 RepID=A0A0L7LZR0_PLAF4|nr:hypothetical protein PFDG_01252 [Plasmodium falciparum Dd2]